MKDPMRLIDRFCYRHPNFGIPNLMRYIVGGNVLFWFLGSLLRNTVLLDYITFDAAAILHGQIWRLVSFLFYPISGSLLLALISQPLYVVALHHANSMMYVYSFREQPLRAALQFYKSSWQTPSNPRVTA